MKLKLGISLDKLWYYLFNDCLFFEFGCWFCYMCMLWICYFEWGFKFFILWFVGIGEVGVCCLFLLDKINVMWGFGDGLWGWSCCLFLLLGNVVLFDVIWFDCMGNNMDLFIVSMWGGECFLVFGGFVVFFCLDFRGWYGMLMVIFCILMWILSI